jgi:hypothetical protein
MRRFGGWFEGIGGFERALWDQFRADFRSWRNEANFRDWRAFAAEALQFVEGLVEGALES